MVANFQKLGGIMFPLGRAVGIVNVTDCYRRLPRKPRPLAAGMNW